MEHAKVLEHIQKRLSAELEDAKGYYEMAKNADKNGDEELTHYLIEMFKDEYSHAYFIYMYMRKNDYEVKPECAQMLKELEEKMEKFR